MRLNKILLTFILTIFVSTGAFASNQDISVTIDGVKLYTDVPPQAINNRTLVPIRAIFEAMGGKVEWNNDTSTATGTRGNDIIQLQLGNPKASINGKEIILDVPARAINQRTLVPVRFIVESFGSDVTWDGKTNTVVIKNKTDESESINNIEKEVLELVNIERNNNGLDSLKMSNELSIVARMKSQDMADMNYFNHTSPTYGSPFDMMERFGIKHRTAAENIARGHITSKEVMNGWMNSEGHRVNILSSKFGTLGVGYAIENGITYWTQMFTD